LLRALGRERFQQRPGTDRMRGFQDPHDGGWPYLHRGHSRFL